jgi:hypothetical protein
MTKQKQKAWELLEKINNHPITIDEWKGCSEYARQALKRKAYVVVDEVISACEYNHVESWNTNWWNQVKEELKKL